ncbi:hypothetical protein VQ643_01735 [Pseudomonas sp. F1_0610]|uniref:pilus assembly PilX family protein n=1 Tax=Pseudomonas sp. F1_0610 TaxID=3114284 RepID=UPI0039C48653
MNKQSGAVILVVLTFLIVLSILAVAGFQEVSVQSKVVASKILDDKLKNSSDVGLREAENRLYGAINLREIIDNDVDQFKENCKTSFNKKYEYGVPCLIAKQERKEDIEEIYYNPLSVADKYWQKSEIKSGVNATELPTKFNSYLISSSLTNSVQWDEQLEGRGTYYYLVNSVSSKMENGKEQLFIGQSIFANYYPGLNN